MSAQTVSLVSHPSKFVQLNKICKIKQNQILLYTQKEVIKIFVCFRLISIITSLKSVLLRI